MHDLLLGLSFIGMLITPALVALHVNADGRDPLEADTPVATLAR